MFCRHRERKKKRKKEKKRWENLSRKSWLRPETGVGGNLPFMALINSRQSEFEGEERDTKYGIYKNQLEPPTVLFGLA